MFCFSPRFFFCRHVLHDMSITFLWIAKIQLECAIRLVTNLPSFAHTDRAWNQVMYRSEAEFVLRDVNFVFFLSFSLFAVCLNYVKACAPRYVWYSRNFKRREPIGTCYTAKNGFSDFFEYSPCRTSKFLVWPPFCTTIYYKPQNVTHFPKCLSNTPHFLFIYKNHF